MRACDLSCHALARDGCGRCVTLAAHAGAGNDAQVFSRGLDLAPGGRKKKKPPMTLRQLSRRLSNTQAKDFAEVSPKPSSRALGAGVRTAFWILLRRVRMGGRGRGAEP